MTVEIVTSFLVLALAIVTMALLLLGVAGVIGVVRFVRCEQCARIGMVAGSGDPACLHCQHQRLLHPLSSRHRVHAQH